MMMASKRTKSVPTKAGDVPVTQVMLNGVRDELKSDISSLEHKMNAGFKAHDARFETVESKIDKVYSEVHRIGVIVEEQATRNNVVLEALTSLFHRQDRVEGKADGIEKRLATLK